jgi:hypothetical protein
LEGKLEERLGVFGNEERKAVGRKDELKRNKN